MINRYPSYYFEFRCVGGDCPDTCCAGWKIAIDDRSLGRYLAYPGGFGNRIRNAIDFKNQSFVQYEHQCVLFNEKGLCDLQAEAGERMLCRTCARYPRHMEDTAHRFARELEHSDTNLERMETMLMKGGCFHIRILMQLLLQ